MPGRRMARGTTADDVPVERAEQAESVLDSSRLTMPAGIIVALSTGFLIAEAIGPIPSTIWTAVAVSSFLFRLVLHRRQALRPTEPDRVLTSSVIGALASGLIWAALPWIILTRNATGDPSAMLATFMLAGTAAGSVARHQSFKWQPIAFVVPSLTSQIAAVMAAGEPGAAVFAVNGLLFLFVLVRASVGAETNFLRVVRMAAEHRTMAASLAEKAAELGEANRKLVHIVDHDPLSGLLNRKGFSDDLERRLVDAAGENAPVALLLVDLDGFKAINDRWGHPVGDAALVEAARRIAAVLGSTEGVSRLGGDEFAVALSGPAAADLAGTIADGLVARLAEPMALGQRLVEIGASIGIAVHPDDGGDARSLIAHADMALYAAKEGGRNRSCRFDIDMLSRRHAQRFVEQELPAALAAETVEVHFQPQVSLRDGGLIGLEALVRWEHPLLGRIAPNDIVDAARRTFSSARLAALVFRAALRQQRRLSERGFPGVRVGVNVSPRDLALFSVADVLVEIAAETGGDVTAVEVEITEDAALDIDSCAERLDALRALGVQIAMDDFGSGNASLALLSRLKVDRIKIDRQFLTDNDRLNRNLPLVQAVIGLARSLGTEVVAEGVETAAVADRLAGLGCDGAQGFHFGRPMPPDALDDWLDAFDGGSWAERPRLARA